MEFCGDSLSQSRVPGVPLPSAHCVRSHLPQGDGFFVPPQSLRDSSPKGTPFGAAVKFPATAKAVPLGKVA